MNPSSATISNSPHDSNSVTKVLDGLTNMGLDNNNSIAKNSATDESSVTTEDSEMEESFVAYESVNNNANKISNKKSIENKTALEQLNNQYESIMIIIANLNEQKIKLFSEGIFDTNNERFITIENNTKLVNEHAKLIKSQITALVKPIDSMLPSNDLTLVGSSNRGIPIKDVPAFNVNPLLDCWNIEEKDKNDKEITLTTFFLKFERLFVTYNLNISKSWFYYLEIAFEGSTNHHGWFSVNLKNSSAISWSDAKTILQQRFDMASQASVNSLAISLINFSLEEKESFILCLERYRMLILRAKINIENNVMLFYLFVNCFPSKVQGKINQIISSNFRKTNPSDFDNVKMHHAPASWAMFEKIIIGHIAVIEETLGSSRIHKVNNKKRRMIEKVEEVPFDTLKNDAPFVASGPTSSAASKHVNFATLRAQGICTYCRTANYRDDPSHSYNCEVKIAVFKRKGYKLPSPPVSNYIDNKNNKNNSHNYNNANINKIDHSVNLSNFTKGTDVSNLSVAPATYDKKLCAISDSDTDTSDNDYDDFFNKYIQPYYKSSNDDNSLNNNKNHLLEKNIFAVRNNNVGDNDNPCNIEGTSLSPATPIIINSILSYGIIDTGASVSLISKKYAQKNNISFHSIPGSLIMANGSKVPRLQTIDPLLVEYDNVNKIIEHKFDIIDDNIIDSDNEKILIGVDLLPKLKIYLSNVAVKHKNLQKEVVDNSKNDDAYIPNVTNFGTEQEQYAFENAIKVYIDKNKKLDKTSLCTIKDAVLHLPTPPGFIANIRQYPIPYALKDQVMEIIESWEKDKIIVPAKPSGWNLPMTVTFKKDHVNGAICKDKKNIRLLLDPRKLNEALDESSKNSHSLPLISDIFNSMTGCVVFSTIDLKSAFNQFPVNEADQIKTTFTAPNNLQYMYRGSPFGISVISQLFSRVMLTLFKDLPYVTCFVDDICIASRSMHAHYYHVKNVLEILTKNNLRINFEKSHFAKSAVYLLGYSISAAGKRIDKRKLTNFNEMPPPKTQKQAQSILGFVNFFRMHLPNAAALMAPLDALRSHDIKINGPFIWTKKHQLHFDAIKKVMLSDVVLSQPEHSHPYCIATDSSDFATGCVLYQVFDSIDHNNEKTSVVKYIGFMSRSFNKHERLYSTSMRELNGVIYALKQFHKFVWGTQFTLYTDHKALCYVFSQKSANRMIIKWLDILLDYTFTVVHIKGMDNILPDALSRLYPPTDSETIKYDKFKQKQHISSPRKNHATSNYINIKKKINSNLIAVDGTLFTNEQQDQTKHINLIHAMPVNSSENNNCYTTSLSRNIFYIQSAQTICPDYVIPPDNDKDQLLKDAHTNIGHYGAEQMVKRLHKEGIHWVNLIGDCIKFVRTCDSCMRYNVKKRGFHPSRHIYSYTPGQHLAIDLAGPMGTTTELNNNYVMVIVDVCTRFCILRPLADKKTATIVKVLSDVFALIGVPSILQSDNGSEFKSYLSKELADALGYDHRFISPLHASANGLAERTVQSVKILLAKATKGVGSHWDLYLNAVQLSLNNRISKKLNTTPFSLFFARRMPETYGFTADEDKDKQGEHKRPMSHEELMKRIDYMNDIVFPAIAEKTKTQIELDNAKFDNKHVLVEYKPNDHVMVRIEKNGQLSPSYSGPYTVVRKTQGNSYVLRDTVGMIMPRNYTSIELKLISHDEVIALDDEGNEIKNYEIEAVINHRGEPRNIEYLVRWKNYSSDWDEWIPTDHFNDIDCLRKYWKNLGTVYKPKKSNVITNAPSSSKALQKNKPSTISKLIRSLPLDEDVDSKTTSSHSKRKRPAILLSQEDAFKQSKNATKRSPTRQSPRFKKSN